MSRLEIIHKLDTLEYNNCKTCMMTKISRLLFPRIECKSELLDMVQSDICDMHATPSMCGKNYFITFIDDFSIFYYVYLLRTKDEAIDKFEIYKNEI